MRKKKDSTMTSVNIDSTLYKNFKKQALEDNISLTMLITRAINTYLTGSNNHSALEQVQQETPFALTIKKQIFQ